VAPARFAWLLSQTKPKLHFYAWAQHPYPTTPTEKPTQTVRWPNVTMTQLGRFESALRRWFGKSVPIWITEYGYETRPSPHGVTEAQQATYAKQAFDMAKSDPNVTMFIWFMFRDDPTSNWQSGLLRSLARGGGPKQLYDTFGALAEAVDEQYFLR